MNSEKFSGIRFVRICEALYMKGRIFVRYKNIM